MLSLCVFAGDKPISFLRTLSSLRFNYPFCVLAMPVGAPEPAIDPNLGEIESIGVGPSPALERGATAAENGDPFLFFSLDDNYRSSGEPFFRANFLGDELNPVASVMSRAHRYIGDRAPR